MLPVPTIEVNEIKKAHDRPVRHEPWKTNFKIVSGGQYHQLPLTTLINRPIINKARKIQNRIIAMDAMEEAMPPKPKIAAIIARINNAITSPIFFLLD
jgi:hypothetical protein